jgi:hypothetical protein
MYKPLLKALGTVVRDEPVIMRSGCGQSLFWVCGSSAAGVEKWLYLWYTIKTNNVNDEKLLLVFRRSLIKKSSHLPPQ